MVHLQKRLGVLLLAATWAIGTGAFEQTKVLAHVSVNLFEKNVMSDEFGSCDMLTSGIDIYYKFNIVTDW